MDVYNDEQTITATVKSINGGNFEATDVTGATASAKVVDFEDTTKVTVTTADVNENAENVTFNFETTNPPQAGTTATLTVEVGGTEYTVTLDANGKGSLDIPSKDMDVYNDEQTITATVKSINGGNFEATDVTGATASAKVVDFEDTTKVTVTTADVNENAENVTFNFETTNPPQAGTTATLTVEVGGTEYTVTLDANGKGSLDIPSKDMDVYNDEQTITATVKSINGGNFEATDVTGATASAKVVDFEDTTKVTVTTADVNENAENVTFNFETTNPPQAGTTATLTVEVGGTEYTVTLDANGKGSLDIPSKDMDVYNDEQTITATVKSINGGNFEATDVTGATASAKVVDFEDTTKVTVTTADVNENAENVTFNFETTNPPQAGTTATLTVEVGGTEYTVTLDANGKGSLDIPSKDMDVYNDEQTITATVKSINGGNFEATDVTGATASAKVVDFEDTTKVTVTTADVNENAENVTFNFETTNPPQAGTTATLTVEVGGTEYTVTLDANGKGSLDIPSKDMDVYNDEQTITATVKSINGGNFEATDVTGATASAKVVDFEDTTKVTVTTADVNENAENVTFNFETTNPPQAGTTATLTVEVGGTEYTVTLDANGKGSLDIPSKDMDVYNDEQTITATVKSINGGNFEATDVTGATASAKVVDFEDTTKVTVTTADVNENAENVTFNFETTNPPQAGTTATLTVEVGGTEYTVTLDANGKGSLDIPSKDMDVYNDEQTITATVKSINGGNFEATDVTGATASAKVVDFEDTTKVTVTTADVNENAENVTFNFETTNPPQAGTTATLTVEVGGTEYTVTLDANGKGSLDIPSKDMDVYNDEQTITATVKSINGGNFEATDVTGATASAKVVDFEDTTKVTVTTADVNENAENVTFNFETTNPPQAGTTATLTVEVGGTEYTVTLDANGKGSLDIPSKDMDVYNDEQTITATVKSINGGNFEATDVTGATASAKVVDFEDTTKVTVTTADVNENAENVTFNFETTNPPQAGTTATLTVEVGGTEYTVTLDANGKGSLDIPSKDMDVYNDEQTITATVKSINGGNFEATDVTGATASAKVVDFEDTTKVTVTTADVNENAENVTFNFETTNPPQAGTTATLTVEVGGTEYTVTLDANGKGSLDIPSKDMDVYNDEQTITATVKSINGGNFEATDVTGATASAKVVDFEDTTKVTVTTADVNENAENVTFNFETTNPPQAGTTATLTVEVGGTEYTVTLDANGKGSLDIPSKDMDVYNDEQTITATVKSINGGNFEATDVTGATASAKVVDFEDTVMIRVFASDSNGNPLTDTQGNYLTVNETAEGGATHYVALAFEPNTTVFNDSTQLDTQLGKVDFTFTNKTTENNDYTPQTTITSIALGTAISMDAVDDKVAENSENLEISIGNYVAPTSGLIYEAVDIDGVVTTTITDNDIAPEAKDNTNTATETGTEFIAAEDEANDGQSATGNVITDSQADIGSNPLSITAINFNGSVINIPTNGDDITITGDYGTLTINNTGAYTYDVNESITDSWNVGKSEIDQFTYTLSDGYNPDDTAKLSITVEGKDDAPVITSISANDRATHTIDGLIDIDGDGIADEYTPDDFTHADKGLIFAGENGDLNINMGTVSSSMSVEYNGGQASYHNAIGYYLADENGNPTEAHIIYVEDASFVGTQAEMLGTLNNLVGNVGFFIIPDGGDKNITTNSEITFDDQGNMVINNTVQTAYYSDNDLNSDNHDHVIATVNEDGGLILGFEDLSLGDKDYDDVVLTIKPCETLSQTDQILNNIQLSDVDDTNLESATIVLKNYQTGDEIKYENLPNGISGNSEVINGTLVITLSGSATIGQYEEAVKSLTFETDSENRDPRTFEFTVNDGDKTSNTKEITVDIGGCSLNTGDYTNTVIATDDYGKVETAQGEFEVTSFDNGNQSEPDVAALKDGGFVVAWTEVSGDSYKSAIVNDFNNDGDTNDSGETVWQNGLVNHDVFIQRYDADGEPIGDVTRVNTFVTNVNEDGGRSQHDVNVVGLENGNYLVTWTSDDQYVGQDSWDNGSSYIQGQIYDVNGNPVCGEFTVARAEYDPIVALPDGGFIVTWSADARLDNTDHDGTANNPTDGTDNPIYSDTHDGSGFGVIAQRFDALGNEVGDRVIVNQLTTNDQLDSDIVMIDDNTAIMTWQSQNGTNGDFDIYAQTLKLTSNGLEVVSNSDIAIATGAENQTNPEVTALSNGTAIITYQSDTNIMAKTVSTTGVGSEVTIAAGANPVITALAAGVVIVYEENGTIFAKTFDGTNVSDATIVSENTTAQTLPAVTTLEDGSYVISWQDENGISAHRYNGDGTEYHQNEFDMLEDNSLTITADRIMENDNDPEGHTFEVISVQDATNGSVTMDANGNITFTPNPDYNGPATFKYTIQDELGAQDTATVYLNVKPVGEPSIFVGTMCDADIQSHNIIVNEGEEAVLAVKISGAEANSTVSLTLADGTALVTEDYDATFSYSFDGTHWTVYDSNNPISIPEGASKFAVKMDTVENNVNEDDELFSLSATLSTGESDTGTVTILDDDTNPPVADAVLTTSNLDTDDAVLATFASETNTPNEAEIAFFKKLDIGGGLDGDITNAENDSSDPADLGGQDIETIENNLVFDITSLPTYGDVYIQVGDVYTKLDASNLDEASTLLNTADTVYWSATHEQVPAQTEEKSIGGIYDNGITASWQSDDVTVIARDENNQEASINYVTNDGIGVSGNTGSGPSNQLGYDPTAQKAESIIFDFKNPVTDASVAITHLIQGENGGEVGTFEAFLDGKSLGVFTFSNNSSAGADYVLTAESHGSNNSAGSNSGTLNIDNLVFDQLRFSAQEYASQGSSTDSSDYFIGGITYHEVPGVEFEYKVIDESNNSSEEVKVVIDVATDTPVPEADTNATPTTTDDSITTPEDTPYTLTMDDFGTYSDETEAQKISIESLPTNGVLKLNGIEISANTEINVSDITTGKLSFTPSKDTDNDSSFNFKVSDGELWSDTHTTTVEVTAIADIPTVSINVSGEEIVTTTVGEVCSTSQDLGNLIAYLQDKGNVSADQVIQLAQDQNGNPAQDQYNLELTSFGDSDLALYDNISNQNATRDINNIDLNNSTAFDSSSATVVSDTINNTYHMTSNRVIFEGNIVQNGNVLGTDDNDVIIAKGEIQGGSNINAGDGDDIIAIIGDIGANQPAIAGGDGTDILYLSKPASSYYFSDIHFHDNLDGHIVDRDTGKTLTFNNIEGIAFGDGSGLNCDVNGGVTTTTEYKYDINISAALADTDNSETLTVSITGVPIGAVLSSDIYTLVDNNDGSWDVTVPAGVKTISDTLTMTTSEQHSDLNLNITARATETNENENGLNYKEATASDALINIEITDSTPNIDGDNIVYEEALTNSYDDREMTTGTFKITTEDGLSNISINGTTITESELLDIVATPKVITTTYGEIEINGYDATTGMVNYSYEIKENTTDHTVANQKDSVVDSISIKVTDTDGDTKENTLDVRIVDDIPTVSDQNAQLTFGADGTVTATTTTNLVFTLDVSGSMTNNDGKITLDDGTQTDRLELAKDAIIDAVGAYMSQGAVNVNLTLFAETAKMVDFSNASGQQSWMTVTENNFDSFKAIVNNVSNSGIGQYTNYEAAIDETVDSYNIGTPNADTTVAYFLSDGNPTAEFTSVNNTNTYKSTWDNNGYDNSDSGDTDGSKSWLDSAYISQWTSFITNNNIEIQALGIGTGIDTSAGSYLAQLAVGNNASVEQVTDPTKLSDTILGNITGSLSGNIFFGADSEGTIDSITVDGIEYTKPTDADETTITTTNGGSLTVDFMDGSYTFEAKQSQYDDGDKETFEVKVSDEDGDSATFNLNISMDSVSERFTLTSDTATIDGGTGYDILDTDGNFDLSSIASRVNNIEEINLSNNNSNDTIHIDLEDIVAITDEDNDLVIRGDNGDTINLDENDGWQRSDTTTNIDGQDFTEYTNTNNSTISVFIDNDLDTTGLN